MKTTFIERNHLQLKENFWGKMRKNGFSCSQIYVVSEKITAILSTNTHLVVLDETTGKDTRTTVYNLEAGKSVTISYHCKSMENYYLNEIIKII